MSKKSHPGDGQYGKGVKGEKRPFDEVFAPNAAAKAKQKPDQEADAPADAGNK